MLHDLPIYLPAFDSVYGGETIHNCHLQIQSSCLRSLIALLAVWLQPSIRWMSKQQLLLCT